MPSTRMYWSKDFYFDKAACAMPVNCFEKTNKNLHCNDNFCRPDNCADKLFKIRLVVDQLQHNFVQLEVSEKLCIGDQIVLFKGKISLKQNNPQKPKKIGCQIYVLSSTDGLIHNFEVHTRAMSLCANQPGIKARGNIVLILF